MGCSASVTADPSSAPFTAPIRQEIDVDRLFCFSLTASSDLTRPCTLSMGLVQALQCELQWFQDCGSTSAVTSTLGGPLFHHVKTPPLHAGTLRVWEDTTCVTDSKQMVLSAILISLAHLQFSVTLTLPFREINLFMLLALILSIKGDSSHKAVPPLPLQKRMQTKNRKRCPMRSLTIRFRRDGVWQQDGNRTPEVKPCIY